MKFNISKMLHTEEKEVSFEDLSSALEEITHRWPQVENDKLNYVFVGSIAQNIYAYISSIWPLNISKLPYVRSEEYFNISDQLHKELSNLTRRIGDIDVISIGNYNESSNCIKKQMYKDKIGYISPEIFKDCKGLFRKWDDLEKEGIKVGLREETIYHPKYIFKVKLRDKYYYINDIIGQAATKMLFLLYDMKRNMPEKVLRYSKDIEVYLNASEILYGKYAIEKELFTLLSREDFTQSSSYKKYVGESSLKELFDMILNPKEVEMAKINEIVSPTIKNCLKKILSFDKHGNFLLKLML